MPKGVFVRTKPVWNKGISGYNRKVTEEEKISKKEAQKRPEVKENKKRAMKEFGNRIEIKKIRSENITGCKNPNWKGGNDQYNHNQAWKLFGKDNCEICNMTTDDSYINFKKRLSMHCTSIPKDYSIMTKENWMCVCHYCHSKKLDAN